jgi:chromosome partitioning protein
MSGRVITIAQQKGGAGKTSLAAHLAVAWAAEGRTVALLDIDPQESLTEWWRRRLESKGAGRLSLRTVAGWRAASDVDRLRREADIVLIDSPPHAETAARVGVRSADLVLIPVQLSPMDVWATRPTIDMATRERVPVLVVANRVPPRGRLPDEMRAELERDRLPMANAQLGNRTMFAASLSEGLGVTEAAPSSPAAHEIKALAAEVLAHASPRRR